MNKIIAAILAVAAFFTLSRFSVRSFPELAEEPSLQRTWAEATRDFQRRFLLETLTRHQFQMTESAKALGLARPALYVVARRLGVDLAQERKKD